MHTVDKGEVARYLLIAHLIKKGATVSVPTSENSSYDLIADLNNILYRIQVKKLILQDDTFRLQAYSKNNKGSKESITKYTSKEIDWLIGVDIDNNKFYLIDYTTGEFDDSNGFYLRFNTPKRNRSNIRYAKDYEF